jgi:hypothetical protein
MTQRPHKQILDFFLSSRRHDQRAHGDRLRENGAKLRAAENARNAADLERNSPVYETGVGTRKAKDDTVRAANQKKDDGLILKECTTMLNRYTTTGCF